MPAAARRPAPRVAEDDAGNELWVFDGATYPQIGLNAIAGRPKSEWSHGAGALRRDAARLLGRAGPARRHGPRRRARVALLPLADRRVRRHGVRARTSDPELGPRLRAGVEPVDARGVGRRRPDAPARQPAAVAARSRDRGRRGAGQRGPRLRRAVVPGEPGRPRSPVAAHRPLGPAAARVRGDRHGRLPAQRVEQLDRGPLAGRAARALHHALPRERDGRRRRLALGRHPDRASPSSRSRSPRAASAGCRCSSTASTTCSTTRRAG